MASLLNNEKYALYYQKIGLLYKRPEIRASLEVILSVFTVIVLVFAAIRPTLINITSLQKKITDQEAVNKKSDNKMAQLINAQTQLEVNRDSLYLYDSAVPDGFSYGDGAKRIEYLAKRNNLQIESLTFSGVTLQEGNKVNGDWLSKISVPSADSVIQNKVTFTVKGSPEGTINFLRQIETMDQLAILGSASLTKQIGQSRQNDSLRASGTLTFYFYSTKQ